MALNVSLQALTQPGATGPQTLSLAANFDPKAVILWATGLAAAGTGAHATWGMGFGTDRGGTVAQWFSAATASDAETVGDTARECGADALLVLIPGTTPTTRDLEIDLLSMQTGATSEVVINWTNLFTTASARINCLILGGSDITDALVMNFNKSVAAATQDVTVVASFGQPDLLFMINGGATDGDGLIAGAGFSFGFGKKGEAGRSVTYGSRDGDTTMFVAMTQRSDVISRSLANLSSADPSLEDSFSLDTTPASNWPTDGFQINYDDQAANADTIGVLALKGTFTATTGSGSAPTAGGLPVIQNLAHGSVPKLGLVIGWNLVAQTTLNTTAAELGAFFVGAGDGTTELLAGISDDDALGTSDANKFWTDTKVVRNYNQAAALQSEADGAISGNDYQLSWNDIDTVAREYQWLTLGSAAAAPTPSLVFRQAGPLQALIGR